MKVVRLNSPSTPSSTMMNNLEDSLGMKTCHSTSRNTSLIWYSSPPTANAPKPWENNSEILNYSRNLSSAHSDSTKFLVWLPKDKSSRVKLKNKQCYKPYLWQDLRKIQCPKLYPYGVRRHQKMAFFPWTYINIRVSLMTASWRKACRK